MKLPAALALGLVLLAYLPADASGQAAARVRRPANEITMEELADPSISGLDVLDAVQRLRPNWMRSRGSTSFRPSDDRGAGGGAAGSCGRGSTSCSAISVAPGDNAPGVLVNEIKQPFEILRTLKVSEVTGLRYLSAQDATTRFGTGFTQGVILISTVAVVR
jgi:hypothetical protein